MPQGLLTAAEGFAAALERIRRNNQTALEDAKPRLENAPLLSFPPRRQRKESSPAAPLPLIVALHGYGGRPEALAGLFSAAGLRQVEVTGLEVDSEFHGFDDYWQPFLGGSGPAPAYLSSVSDAARMLRSAHVSRPG